VGKAAQRRDSRGTGGSYLLLLLWEGLVKFFGGRVSVFREIGSEMGIREKANFGIKSGKSCGFNEMGIGDFAD
jgi:hypothetical protein